MSAGWEDKFRNWAKPPSDSEEQRIERAVLFIKEAIGKSSKLNQRNIRIFVQGSYRNNTNVKRDSDVDVGIVCTDTFFGNYPEGTTRKSFGNLPATYSYGVFKNEVGEALTNHFGPGVVTRGNKAFDIKSRNLAVEADVAPFFEHRRYSKDGSYLSGVELQPDDGKPADIINWPEQHYENGVSKNNNTGKRYKALVRVFKSLRNEMEEKGVRTALPITGFLNECLLWNVPSNLMGNSLYYDDVKAAIIHLWQNTQTDQTCTEWGEVSELKYLFRSTQKWTRTQANDFLRDAWSFIGYS